MLRSFAFKFALCTSLLMPISNAQALATAGGAAIPVGAVWGYATSFLFVSGGLGLNLLAVSKGDHPAAIPSAYFGKVIAIMGALILEENSQNMQPAPLPLNIQEQAGITEQESAAYNSSLPIMNTILNDVLARNAAGELADQDLHQEFQNLVATELPADAARAHGKLLLLIALLSNKK